MLHAFEKTCGHEIPYKVTPRRSGDIAECYADPRKAMKELGWIAQKGIPLQLTGIPCGIRR